MVGNRSENTQVFIGCLVSAIVGNGVSDNAASPELVELLSSLRVWGKLNQVTLKNEAPALTYLPIAIRNAKSGPMNIRDLANSFEKIADTLPWYQREEADLPEFMHGHANAFIVGPHGVVCPHGVEDWAGLMVGVSLLAPKIQYPDHSHPPRELYVVMSSGDWRQDDNAWHSPGLGGLVYNPSNIWHSMRASSEPLLAVWCLWT